MEKGDYQTKYWPTGPWHTPPIMEPDELVVPIHMRGKGCNLRRWVVRLARLRTSLRQASSSLCTYTVSWMCLIVTLLRACFTRANMPLDLATAGVMLHSSPRSLRHLRSEVECAFLGMAASAAATFYYRLGVRRSRWEIIVDVPPKDCISGGPGTIFLPQLILGDGVFTVGVRLLVGAENPVNMVGEVPNALSPLPPY